MISHLFLFTGMTSRNASSRPISALKPHSSHHPAHPAHPAFRSIRSHMTFDGIPTFCVHTPSSSLNGHIYVDERQVFLGAQVSKRNRVGS
ncbi:hypothetical protein K505DRAFT_31928 [Melanomma pulvis-pyrius CBS 109.77]|uniref:Uncharacterized protein n=1 Tax=Melanomma pulvis-pyrius CBS 109.77 TaxID=1314802 RepID=A0A6A6XEA4_9PLEO|nr:hypothetical protein K505DRAFT_31928 [Melanomma pulvis-pyrius CBS 109.77]